MAPSTGPSNSSNNSNSLSASQRTSLRALVDALLPPLTVPRTLPKTRATQRYWETRLAADAVFLEALEIAITKKLCKQDARLVRSFLSSISTPIGTSLVFGTPTWHAFAEWSVPQQTQLLKTLRRSKLLQKRKVFNCCKRLICGMAYGYTSTDSDNGNTLTNPFWEAMGYPGPPQTRFISPSEDASKVAQATRQHEGIPQSVLEIARDTEIDCDVVIVGSGAGGAVAASVLAQAGYAVLVVEKGVYVPPNQISNLEVDALDKLYESKGRLTTRDGAISILAGATVGGGTTVNWGACVALPDYVTSEWCRDFGLDDFSPGAEYHTSVDSVLKRLGASTTARIKHNPMNSKIQEGYDALGYDWETANQSFRTTDDPFAGCAGFGDRYGSKSTSIFLCDAVRHGAAMVTNCRVERVVTSCTEDENDETGPLRTRATGLVCSVGEHELLVNANKCVIISAGSLHTPCILKQSGFRNRHIGKHLHLHPMTVSYGFMEPFEPLDSHLGAPSTTLCSTFEQGPHHDGYGAKLESPSTHPVQFAGGLQWTKPDQFKDRMRRFRNAAFIVAAQRDRSEGSVKLGRDGYTPKIDYALNELDKQSLTKAVKGSLLVLMASGAREVSSSHSRDVGFRINDHSPHKRETLQQEGEAITEYLSQVASLGMKRHEVSLFSTHQTGSCRMSRSPLHGAVDMNGEAWECDDLHILDASIFPTASSTNPMLAVFAVSHMLSRRLALRLRYRDKALTDPQEFEKAEAISAQRTALRSFEPSAFDWHAIFATLMGMHQGTAEHWHSIVGRIVKAQLSGLQDLQSVSNMLVSILFGFLILFPIYSAWWLDKPLW